MRQTHMAIIFLFSILTLLTPNKSESATPPFEVGTFRDETGVEIKVKNSQYPGVQRIVLNGMTANLHFYFPVYYNVFTKEFYGDVGPSTSFQVRDISKGSKDVATFRESEKYGKSEREESGFRIIEIFKGTQFSATTLRALLVVESESGIIQSMKFEKSDAYSIPKFLRPFRRKISETGKVSISPTCEQLFR